MSQGYAITINGVTHNQREWCRIYNIDPSTVKSRMWRHNIPFEQALVMKKQQGHVRVVPPERVGRKEHTTDFGYKAKRSKRCSKCYYGERADSQYVCMYLVMNPEHKRRGCEAGDKCTRFKAKGKNRVTEAQEIFLSNTYGGGYV